jgi:anti-sigma regulatory factor (Ser/Thr protein kinase)
MNAFALQAETMALEGTVKPVSRLTLKSQLEDMAALWPWVEAIVAEYAIPPDTAFGIHLCLEEAISNVIRHGYSGQPGHTLTVDYISPNPREVVFTIEDQAPPFDPLDPSLIEELPAPTPEDFLRPGGRGILLMRKFASSIAYQRLEIGNGDGNRLTIGFVLPH